MIREFCSQLIISASLTLTLLSSTALSEEKKPLEKFKSGNALVVDVRENEETKGPKGMVEGALHLPTSEITQNSKIAKDFIAGLDKTKTIYAYCAVGGRSGKFVERLRKEGFQAENLGGISDVTAAGFPIKILK